MAFDTKTSTSLMSLNDTHEPGLLSWLDSANGHQEFPIQNLPFGVFKKLPADQKPRCGVAIGNFIIDMHALWSEKLFSDLAETANEALRDENLNRFMGMSSEIAAAFRFALSQALRVGANCQSAITRALVPMSEVIMQRPCQIGDYTDFYSSINHATAVGKLFRPQNPLLPNYKWIPIAYHGRASSIRLSGETLSRPQGQVKVNDDSPPILALTERLDYEVELGMFIGQEAKPFKPIDIDCAEQHLFGVCLLNDWSARDIQAWEYQPLGPFSSKNFMTSISPWIITAQALLPFRTNILRAPEDVNTIDYLSSQSNSQNGAIDICMECYITTPLMRERKLTAQRLSETSFKYSFWTIAQMITHHTISGCGLNSGDLLGSGTQSGAQPEQAGSLLELTQGGIHSIKLDSGEQRIFLEDGDEIELRGFCKNTTGLRIGLGSVLTRVLPNNSSPNNPYTNGSAAS